MTDNETEMQAVDQAVIVNAIDMALTAVQSQRSAPSDAWAIDYAIRFVAANNLLYPYYKSRHDKLVLVAEGMASALNDTLDEIDEALPPVQQALTAWNKFKEGVE